MPDFKTENALVLSAKPLGEKAYVLSLFTAEQGRHLGVLKTKKLPVTAAFVQARWQARLADQLGTFYVEETNAFSAAYFDDKKRLSCLMSLCALLDAVLPERQAYPELYQETLSFFSALDEYDFMVRYIKWEVALLEAVGFGLDLTACAGGGSVDDLAYVSPKTGRAVSRQMGEPYHDKLLPLPAFLCPNGANAPVGVHDIADGLKLTGYFLTHHVLQKPLPLIRSRLG